MNHPSIGQIGPESGQGQTDGPLGLEYAAIWSPIDAAQVGYEPGGTNTLASCVRRIGPPPAGSDRL